jgi:hypothetical protein
MEAGGASDLIPCDEDLVDGCLPGRSMFQEHVDLFDVLLLPFVNCDASWKSHRQVSQPEARR